MKKVFEIWILVFSLLFIVCNLSFALPYYSPPDGSFLGTTVLSDDTGRTIGISAWSWLETVSAKTYTYFAYRIFNTSPYNFSPYISMFGVANLSGTEAEVTGSATSSGGISSWVGISLPSDINWFAISGQDLIFPGQFSNAGIQGNAKDYFEYAILGEQVVGLVNVYAAGGGYIVSGETYGVVPEPATMMLLGSLVTGLFGVAAVRKKP